MITDTATPIEALDAARTKLTEQLQAEERSAAQLIPFLQQCVDAATENVSRLQEELTAARIRLGEARNRHAKAESSLARTRQRVQRELILTCPLVVEQFFQELRAEHAEVRTRSMFAGTDTEAGRATAARFEALQRILDNGDSLRYLATEAEIAAEIDRLRRSLPLVPTSTKEHAL